MTSSSTRLHQQAKSPSGDLPRKTNAPRTSTKSVSFSRNVCVKRTLHINNYSDNEIEATWLGDSDYERIRKEMDYTIDLMERRKAIDSGKYTTRGLESRTTKGAFQRFQNKLVARKVVLDEQDLQWSSGVKSTEMLSKAYQIASKKCRTPAYIHGLTDERVARDLDARVVARKYRNRNDSTVYRSSVHGRRRVR